MTHEATEILEQAETEHSRVYDHLRDAADWFHDREGEMFERAEARDALADDLDVDDGVAQSLIAELVGDDVDPITQASVNRTKYVGVAEYKEFDGAYGYLDYHDIQGKRKRVICAQCVHEATYDTEVTHATAGDPEGSFSPNASYSELLEGVHDHYEKVHDGVIPSTVEPGASLVSGTTIGGNTAWHAGNDGDGSGLDADTVDGVESDNLGTHEFSGLNDIHIIASGNTDVPSSGSVVKSSYVTSTSSSLIHGLVNTNADGSGDTTRNEWGSGANENNSSTGAQITCIGTDEYEFLVNNYSGTTLNVDYAFYELTP
jgi:hypothetical protein